MQLLPASCSKALGLGLCLLPLASTASAGEYVIRVVATVTEVNAPPAAPFDGAVVGDTLIGTLEVFNMPSVVSPTYWTYDLDRSASAFRVGTASGPISSNTAPDAVNLASAPQGMGGDFLIVTGELSDASMDTFTIAIFDSTGQMIPSQDLSQSVGTYSGPFPPETARVSFGDPVSMTQTLVADIDVWSIEPVFTPTGTVFCDPASANSTGSPAQLSAFFGSGVGSDLHLDMIDGPPMEFGYFLVGTTIQEPGLPVGNGTLCLDPANPLGRYNVFGTDRFSLGQFDAFGVMQNGAGTSIVGSGFDVPTTLPLPGDPMILSGETWHFQAWYRDTPAGAGASNLPNGVSVTWP